MYCRQNWLTNQKVDMLFLVGIWQIHTFKCNDNCQLGMIQYENDVTQLVFGYFKQSVKVGVDV